MQVNVELKDLPGEPGFDADHALAVAVAAWTRAADVIDRLLISSFDLAAVDRAHATEPEVRTAWLTVSGYDQSAAARTCVAHGHVALHPAEAAVTAALVAEAHELGLTVNAWTVDDRARMRVLAGWGVDGIVTNMPDVLVDAIRARQP
jgi:glycerophosphoryl diester phosphodiesterase